MNAPVLSLALKSAFNRRLTAILTIIAVALSVSLFVGVEKMREGARAGFERTISGTDLIVGARTGPVNLLLYTVFRIGDPTSSISWDSYQEFADRPEIAWTIPISLGDAHKGYRVLGSDRNYFEHYQYGGGSRLEMAAGEPYSGVYDAVLGAAVARELGYELGEEITLSHGIGEVGFHDHDNRPFKVTGILEPTGTPVDRTVHITLQGMEAIHVGWESGAPSALARAASAEDVASMPLRTDEITAFFVGLESKGAMLSLRREINTYEGEPLLAVVPGLALNQLWSVIGTVERVLGAISVFVVFVGLLTILTSILTTLNERRREMAILRSVGARPWHIFALLVSEAAGLAFIGAALGVVLVHGAMAVLAPLAESRLGLALTGLGPGLFEIYVILAVTAASALLGVIPAWRAFRNSLADGLSIRL